MVTHVRFLGSSDSLLCRIVSTPFTYILLLPQKHYVQFKLLRHSVHSNNTEMLVRASYNVQKSLFKNKLPNLLGGCKIAVYYGNKTNYITEFRSLEKLQALKFTPVT